jgi:hypothetical protein
VKRYLESLLGAVVATLLSSFYGQAAVLYSNGPSTYNDAASNITGSDYVAIRLVLRQVRMSQAFIL